MAAATGTPEGIASWRERLDRRATLAQFMHEQRLRVLFASIAPPENHCGVRVVMYRHLVEREPFEVLVATNAEYYVDGQPHVQLRLPYAVHRLRNSRFGPPLRRWIADFENLVWPLLPNYPLDDAVRRFKPDIVLAFADNHLGEVARRTAHRNGLPFCGLFLDWVPVMDGYFGHAWTRRYLSRRFHRLYAECDLAFCTSDGMQEALGPHPNSHVIYPMPGRHEIPKRSWPPSTGRFRLVYVGSVENFYGRMLCSLLETFAGLPDLELIVVGPNADWPKDIVERARVRGAYLGFMPPDKAASVLAGADALLVVMSFEEKYELFMRTSFTTKYLDYVAFGKPVIMWGPEYCTPARVASEHRGAVVVSHANPSRVVEACRMIATDGNVRESLTEGAQRLHKTLFDPERIQGVFVSEIEKLVATWRSGASGRQHRPCATQPGGDGYAPHASGS